MRPRLTSDGLIALIIFLIILGAFSLGGGRFFESILTPSPPNINSEVDVKCCDTGDGDECKPQTGEGQTITYNGTQYGLLKSKVVFVEGNLHLKDSKQTAQIGQDSFPIVLNSSDTHKNFDNGIGVCDNSDTDKYLTGNPPSLTDPSVLNYCTQIPNDQIIFVCKKNCPTTPTQCDPWLASRYGDPKLSCYGDSTTEYDTYFRLSDYNESDNSGIPDFIKTCDKSNLGAIFAGDITPTYIFNDSDSKNNLQLDTFKIKGGNVLVPWFSPFCKPAIYLYPEKVSQVNVKVYPVGKFTYTNPLYPESGWDVTAYPDGEIISNSKSFPYLYYEANVPSLLVDKPTEGFVVEKENLKGKLNEILPRLGLNQTETFQMIDYWEKALPQSPFYFVGILNQKNISSLSKLSISPAPQTLIRVALYFEPLDNIVKVKEPQILTSKRTGYTAVEWGGIIKTDKPFTCFQ